MNHWLLRVGDGQNFINSSDKKIWGVKSKGHKSFLTKIQEGDILWFIKTIYFFSKFSIFPYFCINNIIFFSL